jgi:phosphoglycolate phosphatase
MDSAPHQRYAPTTMPALAERNDSMTAPPCIVFDLDGTLVDTAPDLVATLNVVLGELGHPPISLDTARPMIGHGARAMIQRGLEARRATYSEDDLERLNARFIEHYTTNIAVWSRPFDGLRDALDGFAASGHRLAVLTNKVERLSRRLLDELHLTDRFAAIVGGDTFAFCKPDPRTFLETVTRAGCDPRQAIMVGDSRTDLDTARAAGAPVVLVDFGYTDVPARDLGADEVISHWRELLPAVERLRQAGSSD